MALKKTIDYHYFSIYLMMNIYTCVRENKTSAKYGVPSPSVEEYLGVSRKDCYDGNNADQNMILVPTNPLLLGVCRIGL